MAKNGWHVSGRGVGLYLCHQYSGRKLKEIGAAFGVTESAGGGGAERERIAAYMRGRAREGVYVKSVGLTPISFRLQIHGAYGLSKEFPLERCFRDARTLTISDGTSEIQKMIVARQRIGVSAF